MLDPAKQRASWQEPLTRTGALKAVTRRWSRKLTEAWQRAVEVTQSEVSQYAPTALDIDIAEALLNGAVSPDEIGACLGRTPGTVLEALRDPVAAAWISKQVSSQVANRLGLVDAAMLRRAVGGDVQAAKLLYERAGRLLGLVHHVHHRGQDYTKLTDEQLNTLLLDRLRTARPVEVTVRTLARAEVRDVSPARGDGEAASGGSFVVLPPCEPEACGAARQPGPQEGDERGE